MRHSPIIIPANQKDINSTFWNCSWFSSKINTNILSEENTFFKKWTFSFFYRKQKKIFFRITSTDVKRKHFFSFLKIARKNTTHFVNILRTRRKITNKTMNWVIHNIYIKSTYVQTNLFVYLSCWMFSKKWTEAQKICSKWFVSQCKKRFSILNNKISCKLFWIHPIYYKVPKKKGTDITNLKKLHVLKFILKKKYITFWKKKISLSSIIKYFQKIEYKYLLNETFYS